MLLTDNVDVVSDNTSAGVDKILEALYPTVAGAHQIRFTNPATSAILNVTLTAAVVTSDPVPIASTINTPVGKVGYLLFNSHNAPAEAKLVTAINSLKAAGIQDLVLDLRYNGGGYLDIANELAYMIAGPTQTAGKTFESIQFNSKHPVTDPVTGTPITPDRFLTTTQGFSAAVGRRVAHAESDPGLCADHGRHLLGQRIHHQRPQGRGRDGQPDWRDHLRQALRLLSPGQLRHHVFLHRVPWRE